MTQPTKPDRPIGYWLKRADNLLTEQINKAQTENGVTRSEWQVLNLLMENGRATHAHLFNTMSTFIDSGELDTILNNLMERGWVQTDQDATFALTEAGRQQHAIILARQKEVRQRAMQGISQEEYLTVLRVLERLVNNLETDRESGA